MGDLNIPKIANELANIGKVVKDWRRLYDALELPEAEVDNLAHRKFINMITNYELFSEILGNWKSAKGKQATNQKLKSILESLGLISAEDIKPCDTITVKATEVANILADDAEIREDIVPFFEKLPKVKRVDWWHKYTIVNKSGSGGYKKLIRETLIIWVSRNGEDANVPALITICETEGLADLKNKLESMEWKAARVLQ